MLLELLCATLPCASTVGSVVGTLLFIFVLTAAIGSDGGALSSEFPWQFRLAARLRTPVLVFIVVPLAFLSAFFQGCSTSFSGASAGVSEDVTDGALARARSSQARWVAKRKTKPTDVAVSV